MKTKLTKHLVCLMSVFMLTNFVVTSQDLIKGYSSKTIDNKTEVKNSSNNKTKPIKTGTTINRNIDSNSKTEQESANDPIISQPKNQHFASKDSSEKIIFYESFSSESLDNNWVEDSGLKNMVAVVDPQTGKKYLKISSPRPVGNSFIQIDLTNQLRGKTLKLCGKIKMENIKMGSKPYEIGQLVLKYLINNEKWVYAAVQYLSGTYDWDDYCAHEDGSTDIDNTDRGPYYFYVPKNAKNVILYLGMQNCSGTIYFKDITITEVNI